MVNKRHWVPWAIMGVLVAVCATIALCAVFLPDRAPKILQPSSPMTSAPASVQSYTAEKQVTVVPELAPDTQVSSKAEGTVTDVYTPKFLKSGQKAYQVNETNIIPLATDKVMYRDLHLQDTGEDVLSLNQELHRLGLDTDPHADVYGTATQNAWKELMRSNGNDSDGSFLVKDVVWIPQDSVHVSSWEANQGTPLASGQAIGKVKGSIQSLQVKNLEPVDHEQTLQVFGKEHVVAPHETTVEDDRFCEEVSNTDEYLALDEDALHNGFEATLQLSEPMQVLRVPASAVFSLKGNNGCIVPLNGKPQGKATQVTVVGAQLGTSLVQIDGKAPSDITLVTIGPELVGLTCGKS